METIDALIVALKDFKGGVLVITHILPALQRSLNQRFRVSHFYFGLWLATHPYGQTV